MGGAIRFYRPAGQQQADHDAQHQLFLLCQPVHAMHYTKTPADNNTQCPLSENWISKTEIALTCTAIGSLYESKGRHVIRNQMDAKQEIKNP